MDQFHALRLHSSWALAEASPNFPSSPIRRDTILCVIDEVKLPCVHQQVASSCARMQACSRASKPSSVKKLQELPSCSALVRLPALLRHPRTLQRWQLQSNSQAKRISNRKRICFGFVEASHRKGHELDGLEAGHASKGDVSAQADTLGLRLASG
eukprot:s1106_g8.t1